MKMFALLLALLLFATVACVRPPEDEGWYHDRRTREHNRAETEFRLSTRLSGQITTDTFRILTS